MKVPNFVEENLPRFTPTMELGPPMQRKEQTLLDAYFGGDVTMIQLDMQRRPEHYTPEQRALIDTIKAKTPLPPGVDHRNVNEIVLRFMESTQQSKKRDTVVAQAKKRLGDDDPSIDRKIEEDEARKSMPPSFEQQGASPSPMYIKII